MVRGRIHENATAQGPHLGSRRFCASYRCFSVAHLDRPSLEFSDKVILPQKAFREAHRLGLKLPMLFNVANSTMVHKTLNKGLPPAQFCGVLEFSAPDGKVFAPYWMMQNLLLSEGDPVELKSICQPPTGSFIRFRPNDDSFLALAALQGPRALMEGALRHYSVLSEGITIAIQHEGHPHYLDVEEVRARVSPTEGKTDQGYRDEAAEKAAIERGDRRGSCNKRHVSLVSLLGDLDLEVEFSSDSQDGGRSRLVSDQVVQPELQPRESEAIGIRQLSPASRLHSLAEAGDSGRWRDDSGVVKTQRVPLPLPAKATKDGRVASRERRSLGNHPFRNRFKAFSGQGRTLGTCQGTGVGEGQDCSTSLAQTTVTGSSPANTGKSEEYRAPRQNFRGRDQTSIGQRAKKGEVSFFLPQGGMVLGEGGILTETALGAEKTRQAEAKVGSPMVACGLCGKGIPEANYRLHQLRCTRAPISIRDRGHMSLGQRPVPQSNASAGKLLRDAESTRYSLGEADRKNNGTCDFIRGRGRGSGGDPEQFHEEAGTATRQSQDKNEPLHRQNPTSVGEVDALKGQRENHVCNNSTWSDGDIKPISERWASSMTSCEFCGLLFKDTSAISAHQNLCGARTDLCNECCNLVPRRDAKSHRQPGGECDANIAKALAVEQAISARENAETADAMCVGAPGSGVRSGEPHGSWSAGAARGGPADRRQPKEPFFGVGSIDRLLADATQSSRRASIALQAIRAENDRMMTITNTKPRLRESIASESEVDRGVASRLDGSDDPGRSKIRDEQSSDYGMITNDTPISSREGEVAEMKEAERIVPLDSPSSVSNIALSKWKKGCSSALPETASSSRTFCNRSGSGRTTSHRRDCRRDSSKVASDTSTLSRKLPTPGVLNSSQTLTPTSWHSRGTRGISPQSRALLPPVLELRGTNSDLAWATLSPLRRASTVVSTRGVKGRDWSRTVVHKANSGPSPSLPGMCLGNEQIRSSVGERTPPAGQGEMHTGARSLRRRGIAPLSESRPGLHSFGSTNRIPRTKGQSVKHVSTLLRENTLLSRGSLPGRLLPAETPRGTFWGGTPGGGENRTSMNMLGAPVGNLPMKCLRGSQV